MGVREEGKGEEGGRMGPMALAPELSNPKPECRDLGALREKCSELQLCPARLQGQVCL